MKALPEWFKCCPTSSEAEALRLREVIFWVGEIGLSMLQIELYYKLVVDVIMGKFNN